MKRFHLLLIGLALCAAVAVGYSDSHEIKKESIQVGKENPSLLAFAVEHTVSFVELPCELVVFAPYLGSPASNHVMVSEELTGVLKMRIRPPPEKVQKSDYNYRI